jgi:hypothetical protein
MEQNEIDELMKGGGAPKDEAVPEDDKISWDDVKDEMEQSKAPPQARDRKSVV